MNWTGEDTGLSKLDTHAQAQLNALAPQIVPAGAVLFSPGDAVKGYVIVLSGRVDVHLLGPTGRDILLYAVVPGQSCIQSTLGLLGGDAYTGEAVASAPTRFVLLPRTLFLELLDESHRFRLLVFETFAARMQSMMQLVENVSFVRVESRLVSLLLERADANGRLEMTQADMARAIGSAREVVSRRLDKLAREGLLEHERGVLHLIDRAGLAKIVEGPAL